MRKLLTLALATVVASTMAVSAFAATAPAANNAGDAGTAPSYVFQELGNVIDANKIIVGTSLAPAAAPTVGGTTINDIQVGLGNGLEVRTGAIPNNLALVGAQNSGATLKYAGFIPGLAVYGAYGSNSTSPANTGASTFAFGGAYEMAMNGFILNGNIQLSNYSATPVAGTTNTANATIISGAAYYPYTQNILLAGQIQSTSIGNATNGANAGSTSQFDMAAGVRLHKDSWVIDALVFLNRSTTTTPPAGAATTGGLFSMGAPVMVNVAYTF